MNIKLVQIWTKNSLKIFCSCINLIFQIYILKTFFYVQIWTIFRPTKKPHSTYKNAHPTDEKCPSDLYKKCPSDILEKCPSDLRKMPIDLRKTCPFFEKFPSDLRKMPISDLQMRPTYKIWPSDLLTYVQATAYNVGWMHRNMLFLKCPSDLQQL